MPHINNTENICKASERILRDTVSYLANKKLKSGKIYFSKTSTGELAVQTLLRDNRRHDLGYPVVILMLKIGQMN